LIEKFEKATGFKIQPHIEEIEIAGPETYAHYTGAYQGLIYGYDTDSWDAILPRMMMVENDELIKGLKLTSGWGSQTLGYSSSLLCGYVMAMMALASLQKKEMI
jgi:hypothetical protein